MHVIDYSLIILAFSLIIILVFSRKISKPIRFLQKAAHQVAAGDFDVKVYLDNNDELKDLASSFNYMTERIKELFSEISVHKEELEQVISSINEGFVVIDENGKLLIINEGFLNIVNRREVIGKFYWEVIQNTVFTENIKKILKKRKGSSFEVKINEHFYWCGANYMDVKNEIALIMNDITQLKNLEDIKKDFVMNVSHELRTPLTAIKGFIETLDEEDQIEKVREYLEIIGRHTNRLINIVEDLLLLSNLENNTSVLIKSDVNIKELIEVVLKIFEQKVKEKRLRLEFRFDENIPTIQADAFRLEQLMINLIDNAVKYTDEGSITISINMTVSGRIRLVIQDTGIGIPKVQHDRIFERFYTVDKSRSRRLGSTGLGLSIVKHIVLLHKGEIYVDSTIEKGTKFVVVLPVGQEIIMP
jgi:two-component system phosphate regulon sensor histidine kinase PhoR